jgi:hypothetical protein
MGHETCHLRPGLEPHPRKHVALGEAAITQNFDGCRKHSFDHIPEITPDRNAVKIHQEIALGFEVRIASRDRDLPQIRN